MTRTVTGTYLLAWGSTRPGRHEITVASVQELDAALDRVEQDARAAGLPQLADLWAGHWSSGQPTPDPLVQVLIGHPERSSVIWHHDGDLQFATVAAVDPLTAPIPYERSGQPDELDPEWARLTPTDARAILTRYLQTAEQPHDGVTWVTPADW